MQRRSTGAAFLAVAAVAAACAAQQGVLLRFTPPVGQVTHYRYLTQIWAQVPGMSSGDSSQPVMTHLIEAGKLSLEDVQQAEKLVRRMAEKKT